MTYENPDPFPALSIQAQPRYLTKLTATVDGRRIETTDFTDAKLLPGDRTAMMIRDGRACVVRSRLKPWWRRWPWARYDETVVGGVQLPR